MCACTCMAGLGEACSHIGAVLFALEYNTSMKKSTSVTSLACSWLPPSMQKVEYATLSNIDFSTSKQKKVKLDQSIIQSNSPTLEPNIQPSHVTSDSIGKLSETTISQPNNQEISSLHLQLSKANPEAAIPSLIPPYNEKFVKTVDPEVPPLLNELFTEKYMDDTYEELLEKAKECFMQLSVTVKQAQRVEELTKTQIKSRSWFAYRAGRITASRFRAVVHTNLSKPSLSLVKSICYPYYNQFTSKYTEWGCQHEEEAIKEYTRKMNTLYTKDSTSPRVVRYFILLSPLGCISRWKDKL